MSNKRFWWSVLAVWIVMWVTNWIGHGWWLASTYQQTAQWWRPAGEMQHWMWVMWIGWAAWSWAFVWIWSKGLSQTNLWWQAVRYAWAIITIWEIPWVTQTWATTPYPGTLVLSWLFIGIVQAMLCAFVMTWTYKPALSWASSKSRR
jgi:hypothetical protein